MNKDTQNIEELIAKYLLGEAEAQENVQLHEWRISNPQNELYYQDLKKIWTLSKREESNIDVEVAWQRFKTKVITNENHQKTRKIALPLKQLMRAAAMLLIIVGGYFIYQKQNNNLIEIKAEGLVKIQTLPDNSVVTLNKNASISFPEKFDGDTRKVNMKGEAFFEITANKSKPFIIEANGVNIKVVGTSFNVKTSIEKTEVIVATGIVEVSRKEKSIRLSPNEKVVVNKRNKELTKLASEDALYNYYRNNEFVCNNTPLWRIVEVLNEAYDARIKIENPSIENLPLTTTFKNENLNNILMIIESSLDISVTKKGDEYVLR